MWVGPESLETRVLNVEKLKENKKKQDDGEETGCWIKFRLFGRCISSKVKVESSISGSSTQYAESKSTNDTNTDQPVAPVASSSTTSNSESLASTPNITQELKIASQLRKFNFVELKSATRNFRPESLLGEGGFGCVFKGWINESGTAPVKPGTGLTVAVKTLNHDGLQVVWAACNHLDPFKSRITASALGYEDENCTWKDRMSYNEKFNMSFLDYNAKLFDFGLAKNGPEGDKTHVSTRVMGTYGYAAPDPEAPPKPQGHGVFLPYFLAMQSERTGSNLSNINGSKGHPVKSLSISNSPYHQNQ
ncbi:hypothetical protein E3N88_24294 [Mikania micrantha]|uniref:Protein kinase domain-containing protein n=1 Tax=Mikania micrantha TaxID=192012 RepID=A0A5N6NHG7_9ASTR|nr:hypothetical protein E3N88_24294 [Mikania micrantha]